MSALLGFGHVADVVKRHRSDRNLFGGRTRQWADHGRRAHQVVLCQHRRLCRPRFRAAARRAASRTNAGKIGNDETRCTLGDFVEVELLDGTPRRSTLEQLFADGAIGQAQTELAITQVGCPQPRVDAARAPPRWR